MFEANCNCKTVNTAHYLAYCLAIYVLLILSLKSIRRIHPLIAHLRRYLAYNVKCCF